MVGISLSADGLGWVAGQTGGIGFPPDLADGERLDGCATNDQASASFDLGNLGDSVILRYVAR